MTANKIAQVKKYQQDYFIKFGERLDVDWEKMNGITNFRLYSTSKVFYPEIAEAELSRACFNNGTTPDNVRNLKRIYKSCHTKESNAVREWAKWIKDNQYSYRKAAGLINKERTTLLYYTR